MSDRDDLFSFEHEIDKKIAQSNVFQLPLRSVLTHLFWGIDVMVRGQHFGYSISKRQTEAEALGSRLSYLAPFLKKCTSQIGVSAIHAFSTTAQFIEDFQELISYSHFCELMPEVRKGYYEVRKFEEGFELVHPNEEFAMAEEYDIILTELSLTFLVGKAPNLKEEFIELARQVPNLNMVLMCKVLAALFQYRLNSIKEVPILEPNAFQISIGTTWEEFCKVRAALFAYADYSIGLANALEFLWFNESNNTKKEALFDEFYEWVTVFNTKSFFMGLLMALTNVESSAIESILKFFTLNVENQDFENAGDGFFPPLVDYSHSYLFSPYILRSMLVTRNIFYVLNRRNRNQFDNIVSQHLEPTLLKQAVEIWKILPDLRIVSNKSWSEGEFDLLIYQSSSNTVLHIQAKAPIPPQGARMTKAVENRSKEGIDQLNRFQNLPQNRRDSVISEIFEIRVEEVRCVSVLLCRAGLGTHSVWKLKKDITVLNLQLLNGVIKILSSKSLNLSDFKGVTDSLLIDIYNRAVLGWEQGSISLNGILIRMPLLKLNYDEISCSAFKTHIP
ncbi:hypothetical protein [Microcoleus sp. S13C4]|uniref:hypothetical protein n=1 Tax=Microcoleus sp. S13C4 TaxID=3055410 RepID=UPI002FD6F478